MFKLVQMEKFSRLRQYMEANYVQVKKIRWFVISAGALLTITAVAKFVSGAGDARVLEYPEPITSIPFKYVFWSLGVFELAIALVCFFGKRVGMQTCLLAWLATNFVAYRLGLLWLGHKPCSCLGNLTDALHIPPQTADTAMKIILAYLLIGSYATLFWLWRQNRKTPPLTPPAESTV